MKVFCVIPSWNQKETLAAVINEVAPFVDKVVVVDDGSSDKTIELAGVYEADFIRHAVNRGQGAALKTGTNYALEQGADIVVHFDADGQFRASDIERVIEPIKNERSDIVFGSRFLDNTTVMPGFKKNIIMPIARLVNRLLFNVRLTDPQSGFRALNRKAAVSVNWQQDRMAHCSEILLAAHQGDFRIEEAPITVLYNNFGQRFGGGLKILRDLFISKLNH